MALYALWFDLSHGCSFYRRPSGICGPQIAGGNRVTLIEIEFSRLSITGWTASTIPVAGADPQTGVSFLPTSLMRHGFDC